MDCVRSSHFRLVAKACFLLLIAAGEAAAQTLESTDRLAGAAAKSTTVYVVDNSGEITKGRLTDLTNGALLLQVGGQARSIRLAGVARVEKRDSNRNGALIGGFTTLALWFIPMYAEGERCTAICVPVAAYVFGLGAGLGALIDLATPGRTVLYEGAATIPAGRRASGAARRAAFLLTLRF